MLCRTREHDVADTKKRKDATAEAIIAEEEEVYEKHSRSHKKKPEVAVVDLLPFKAADGSLVYDKSRSADALAMVCSRSVTIISLELFLLDAGIESQKILNSLSVCDTAPF